MIDLLMKYNMHEKFLFSSFSYDQLREVELVREKYMQQNPRFDVIYLYNYENLPLPTPEEYTSRGDGINISANHLTLEVVQLCKEKGLKVGVWIRTKDFTESEDFYLQMMEYGVDFICSDFP